MGVGYSSNTIHPRDIAKSRVGTIVFLVLWSLCLVLIWRIAGPISANASRAPRMESVQGTLVSSSTVDGARYEYAYRGTTRVGTRADLFPRSRWGRGIALEETPAHAHEWVVRQGLRPGDAVTVIVDPDETTVSALYIDQPDAAGLGAVVAERRVHHDRAVGARAAHHEVDQGLNQESPSLSRLASHSVCSRLLSVLSSTSPRRKASTSRRVSATAPIR